MGLKALAGVVDSLSRMVLAQRARKIYEVLAELPDGAVVLDILARKATHSTAGSLSVTFTDDLASWLTSELARERVDPAGITAAEVTLVTDTTTVPTDRRRIVHFLAKSHATIEYQGRIYQHEREGHVWLHRLAV